MATRRIVITGVGMLTSLALNTADTWSKILAGKSGVKNITSFDTEKIACKIASEIPEFNAENNTLLSRKNDSSLDTTNCLRGNII